MMRAVFVSLLMLGAMATPVSAQQTFAQAIGAMETIVFNKPQVQPQDIAVMDSVLRFVSANLPVPAVEQSTRSLQSSSSTSGTWQCRRCYYRDCRGRLCWRCVWVRVCPKPQKYSESKSMTTLGRKVEELQNAIANFPNDPGVNLRDLALQVYGATLSADSDSQAGRIIR